MLSDRPGFRGSIPSGELTVRFEPLDPGRSLQQLEILEPYSLLSALTLADGHHIESNAVFDFQHRHMPPDAIPSEGKSNVLFARVSGAYGDGLLAVTVLLGDGVDQPFELQVASRHGYLRVGAGGFIHDAMSLIRGGVGPKEVGRPRGAWGKVAWCPAFGDARVPLVPDHNDRHDP